MAPPNSVVWKSNSKGRARPAVEGQTAGCVANVHESNPDLASGRDIYSRKRRIDAAILQRAENSACQLLVRKQLQYTPVVNIGRTGIPDSQFLCKKEETGGNACPTDVDYRRVLQLFPDKQLASRIFGTLENCRIDRRLRKKYRGLTRDLDLIREHLRRSRPSVFQLPAALLPFELLFQTTLLGGATDDARQYYSQIVSELETVTEQYCGQ